MFKPQVYICSYLKRIRSLCLLMFSVCSNTKHKGQGGHIFHSLQYTKDDMKCMRSILDCIKEFTFPCHDDEKVCIISEKLYLEQIRQLGFNHLLIQVANELYSYLVK